MNLIGRQVSRLRYQRGWTQDMLADKLQLAGWMISRSGVSKIENGSMYVSDFRLLCFAHIFGIEIPQLFVNVNIQAVIRDMRTQSVAMEDALGSSNNILTKPTTEVIWKTFPS